MDENKKIKSKLCFDPRIARKCIHEGCNVIDIKPNRENLDKSIIVFEDDEHFKEVYARLMEEFKKKEQPEVAE